MLARVAADRIKRGLLAPLLFLAFALATAGSNYASPLLWTGALLSLWGALATLRSTRETAAITPLSLGTGFLAVWIVTTNLFVNPSYTSAASYHAAFLFGGYLIGRRAAIEQRLAFGAVLAFGLTVAGWALWQQLTGVESRAHGPFITPATLAATSNLMLAPGLVLVALGVRHRALLVALTVLSAALLASQSRGGWIALFAAMVTAFVLIRRVGLQIAWRAAARLGAILLAGAIIAWLLLFAADRIAGVSQSVAGTASFSSRLELWALAATNIRSSSLLLGDGYHAFYYLLEAGRDAVPSYMGGTTDFVHNDYLQMLLELGLSALAMLLYLVLMPLVIVWRNVRRLPQPEQRLAIAIAATVSSIAIHALVDFPFYIPVCVLIYAGALGFLDDVIAGARKSKPLNLPRALAMPVLARRALVAAIGTIAAWILAMPAAAEAASIYAEREWRDGNAQSSAFWFEAARRLDARDWRYHWYVGQFWTAQAAARADPAAAKMADAALAASQAANPREVRSLQHRIVLHRRLRALLPEPADPATLRAWADRALQLSPTDVGVRAERERVWKEFPE